MDNIAYGLLILGMQLVKLRRRYRKNELEKRECYYESHKQQLLLKIIQIINLLKLGKDEYIDLIKHNSICCRCGNDSMYVLAAYEELDHICCLACSDIQKFPVMKYSLGY